MCIFNELLDANLFLALDSTSMHTDPSMSGRKYCKLTNNPVFIRNEAYLFFSVVATSAFQLKHMPCGLSDMDHQIWENISHVALWEILLARI